jgi:uncharacterized pyridoxamine 5'-phosphate oxidase family protein/ferredoxin
MAYLGTSSKDGKPRVTPMWYIYENGLFYFTTRLGRLKGRQILQNPAVSLSVANEEHPYCSRICCSHAVKNALKLKEKDPQLNVYVLYRDVRTYGFYETFYHEARKKGVIFIRYDLQNKPKVSLQDGSLRVSLHDPAMNGPVTLPADRVILSTGIEPNDHHELARIFDVDLNPDSFFMEANPKSAPLDSVDRGKFFCGLCHSPNFIEDVISQSNAVAARAGALLSKEAVEEKAYLAYVIKRLCCGCGLCVRQCNHLLHSWLNCRIIWDRLRAMSSVNAAMSMSDTKMRDIEAVGLYEEFKKLHIGHLLPTGFCFS